MPELVGLQRLQPATDSQIVTDAEEPTVATPPLMPSPYFVLKRYFDLFATVVLLALFAPFWVCIGMLALCDVGSPIFFWQQRLGQSGRTFLLHKIRTLKPPFDWRRQKIPEAERLSAIGRFIRKYRFDEVAQLLNVLVGDMSLIGPRPLLPRDQPANPSVRLSVRPGITGWAQVNGGKLLDPEQKDALDEWYIRNASFRLDIRILFMTLQVVLRGERLGEAAIAEAFAMRQQHFTARAFQSGLFPMPAKNNASIIEPATVSLIAAGRSNAVGVEVPMRSAR